MAIQNRRAWLRAACASSAVIGITTYKNLFAQNPHYREIRYRLHEVPLGPESRVEGGIRIGGTRIGGNRYINRRSPMVFTEPETRLIRNAVSIVANRMLSPDILRTALRESRVQFDVFQPRPRNWDEFRRRTISQFNGLLRSGFPILNIAPYVENSDFNGWAVVKEAVRVRYSNTGSVNVSGVFHIHLNKIHLGPGTDANFLAGTIAHEMLHQMAHDHRAGLDGYCDDNFITVFGDLVKRNGRYIQRPCTDQQVLRLHSGEIVSFPKCGN